MTPSLDGWPTKTKEVPSPHDVRLNPLDMNSVFKCLGVKEDNLLLLKYTTNLVLKNIFCQMQHNQKVILVRLSLTSEAWGNFGCFGMLFFF